LNIKSLLSISIIFFFVFPSTASSVDWKAAIFKHEGFTLPYNIYLPSSSNKIPLIIHLHGTGRAGTNNKSQLYLGRNIGPDYFASNKIQSIQKSIVLAPQTPKNMRWANTSLNPYNFKSTPPTQSMVALLKLIDSLVSSTPEIDPSRIYMTGLSRGGQGVWNAAMMRPNLFAAIVPISGSGSPKDAHRIIKIPTWAFHASNDNVTNVNYTRDMVDAIIRSGGTTRLLRYTEIEGGQHSSSWLKAYKDDKLYHWMLSHHR
jgi:predicted peptidase